MSYLTFGLLFAQTLIADFRARGGRIHVLSGKGKVNGISRDPSPKASKEMLEESLLSEATSTAGICWEKKVCVCICVV